MSRTNIDIDDEVIAAVMHDYRLKTKREAVDLALRLARRPKPLTPEEVLAMEGTGFLEGNLEAIKTSRRFASDDRSESA